jgi:hypothetical protein
MAKPTYAHFPVGESVCRVCGHLRTFQPEEPARRQYWCQKVVEQVQAGKTPNGGRPWAVGQLDPSTLACKYFLDQRRSP